MKETVLYDREKKGIHVEAKQVVETVVVTEATEDKAEVTKEVRKYLITATKDGEEVFSEEGASYRQTIQRARKVFQEQYDLHAPKEEPKVEAEAVEAEATEPVEEAAE